MSDDKKTGESNKTFSLQPQQFRESVTPQRRSVTPQSTGGSGKPGSSVTPPGQGGSGGGSKPPAKD